MYAFSKAVEVFLFHCEYEKNLTDKTLNAYSIDLHQFSNHISLRSTTNVQDIKKDAVRLYLRMLHTRYKPRSIKRKIATLKAFFTFLEYEDIIQVNPFRKLRIHVDKIKELPKAMSLETVRRLFLFMYDIKRSASQNSKSYFAIIRDIAIVEMLFSTVMRVGELCSLTKTDVDTIAETVKVFGKGRKERLIPLCDSRAIQSLQDYERLYHPPGSDSHPYFIQKDGRAVTDQSVRLIVSRRADQAGLPSRITPHMFRHTLATLLLSNGVDIRNIQYLLGHSSISVTALYAQVTPQSQKKILQAKHPGKELFSMDN